MEQQTTDSTPTAPTEPTPTAFPVIDANAVRIAEIAAGVNTIGSKVGEIREDVNDIVRLLSSLIRNVTRFNLRAAGSDLASLHELVNEFQNDSKDLETAVNNIVGRRVL